MYVNDIDFLHICTLSATILCVHDHYVVCHELDIIIESKTTPKHKHTTTS